MNDLSRVPYPDYRSFKSTQRGGRFGAFVLVTLLLSATIAQGALIAYQYKHPRVIVLVPKPAAEEHEAYKDSGALQHDGACALPWEYCWKTA